MPRPTKRRRAREGPSDSSSSPASSSDDEAEGSSSASSSDEAEPLELDLDEDGRPVGVTGVGAGGAFSFRAYDAFLALDAEQLAAARRACAQAFSAREARRGAYSKGATFWLPATRMRQPGAGADAGAAGAEPPAELSPLERLARHVFEFHTRGLGFDARRSGAEWWTMVIGASRDAVGLHWDRDYNLEADHGVNVHPAFATVTYLSDVGHPTVILENAAPVLATDPPPAGARAVHVAWPRAGKHVSFDGRWLHGVPGGVPAARPGSEEELRVTFLVNVWLNHVPASAVEPPRRALRGGATPRPRALRFHGGGVGAARRARWVRRVARRPLPPPPPLLLVLDTHADTERRRNSVDEVRCAPSADALYAYQSDDANDEPTAAPRASELTARDWRVYTDQGVTAEGAQLRARVRLPLTRLRALATDRGAGGASSASLLLSPGDVAVGAVPVDRRARARAPPADKKAARAEE